MAMHISFITVIIINTRNEAVQTIFKRGSVQHVARKAVHELHKFLATRRHEQRGTKSRKVGIRIILRHKVRQRNFINQSTKTS